MSNIDLSTIFLIMLSAAFIVAAVVLYERGRLTFGGRRLSFARPTRPAILRRDPHEPKPHATSRRCRAPNNLVSGRKVLSPSRLARKVVAQPAGPRLDTVARLSLRLSGWLRLEVFFCALS